MKEEKIYFSVSKWIHHWKRCSWVQFYFFELIWAFNFTKKKRLQQFVGRRCKTFVWELEWKFNTNNARSLFVQSNLSPHCIFNRIIRFHTKNKGYNNLGAEGANYLSDCLKRNSSLTTLHLGFFLLFEGFNLETIIFTRTKGSNNFGAVGTKYLCDGLSVNTSLTKLSIGFEIPFFIFHSIWKISKS